MGGRAGGRDLRATAHDHQGTMLGIRGLVLGEGSSLLMDGYGFSGAQSDLVVSRGTASQQRLLTLDEPVSWQLHRGMRGAADHGRVRLSLACQGVWNTEKYRARGQMTAVTSLLRER